MKRYILLTTFLLLLSLAEAGASVPYRSQKLQQMAATLQAEHKVACEEEGSYTLGDFTLTVKQNKQREVCHIGFKLFAEELTEQNPSPIYQFVERYLLELYLMKGNEEIREKLEEDKVKLRLGNRTGSDIKKGLANYLPRIARSNSLSITTDNSHYAAIWMENGQVLCRIKFPIQYELLWGMNKKEIEVHFYTDLLYYKKSRWGNSDELPTPPEELTKTENDCYVWKGEWYAIEAMNGNRYYLKRRNGSFEPVCSSGYPVESMHNLFSIGCHKRLQAKVVQRLYGQKRNEFEVPLTQLINFCKDEGCEVFVGIEEQNGYIISGTVTLLNRALGYNHLLYFKADHRLLGNPKDYTIDIDLYAYIPEHNLHNLYYDNNNMKK